jgi:protein-tyrosine-phosphatase/DNA-binding transcriptional ArsR family regulator
MYRGGVVSSPPAFVRLAAHPLRWRLLTELAVGDYRVRELVSLVGEPQNLVSYHLRLLRDGGLVTVTRSSFDGRDTYYHLDLDRCADALAGVGAALHPSLDQARRQLPRLTVLFVCTGNSARSPIAEALLRRHSAGKVKAVSAGTHPKSQLHPDTVRVLRERFTVEVAAQRPRHLATLTGRRFDYVITLCDKAREVCSGFSATHWVHWSVAEPAGYSAFARTADDIDARVRHLLPVLARSRTPDPKEVAP